jgi:hypothetical protein
MCDWIDSETEPSSSPDILDRRSERNGEYLVTRLHFDTHLSMKSQSCRLSRSATVLIIYCLISAEYLLTTNPSDRVTWPCHSVLRR